jgi:hypothetical protein
VAKRKHISLKTKLAATLLRLPGGVPYNDAKQMTEDQIISLYHFDHNIFHESGHPDADRFWNLTPLPIKAHREKTKRDRKIIDKGRRIRAWNEPFMNAAAEAPTLRTGSGESKRHAGHGAHVAAAPRPASRQVKNSAVSQLRIGLDGQCRKADDVSAVAIRPARTLRSRGFDKRFKRKMDGTVVKR